VVKLGRNREFAIITNMVFDLSALLIQEFSKLPGIE
jgi:hypothetical protein